MVIFPVAVLYAQDICTINCVAERLRADIARLRLEGKELREEIEDTNKWLSGIPFEVTLTGHSNPGPPPLALAPSSLALALRCTPELTGPLDGAIVRWSA